MVWFAFLTLGAGVGAVLALGFIAGEQAAFRALRYYDEEPLSSLRYLFRK